MSKKSKTIKVEDVKTLANNTLKSEGVSQEHKKGVCGMIESVLMNTGNYGGFGYLYWNRIGYKLWQEAGEPGFPEKTQFIGPEYDRVYF